MFNGTKRKTFIFNRKSAQNAVDTQIIQAFPVEGKRLVMKLKENEKGMEKISGRGKEDASPPKVYARKT